MCIRINFLRKVFGPELLDLSWGHQTVLITIFLQVLTLHQIAISLII